MITSILPGTSVEVSAGSRDTSLGVVGVVTMPFALSWGDKVTTIRKGSDTLTPLGYKLSDPKMKLVNEVMNYANELILYRLNSGTKATATISSSGLTVTAKYGGARGNDITVTIEPSGSNFIVKTYLGTLEVDSQIVASPAGFVPNDFITLGGTGSFESGIETGKLAGGTDGSQDTGAINAYITEIEKHDWNVMAYTGSDVTEQAPIVSFINEMQLRSKNVFAVMSGNAADNKYVYNSTIGGVTDNYTLTPAEACATMAGIISKQGITGGCTYFDVIGWNDVDTRLTKLQMEIRTQNGEILFVYLYGGVKVLYDINSLTTFTTENPEDFRKGLVIRTLSGYAAELQKLLDTRCIGKIRNSKDGRSQIKGMIATMTTADYLNKGYIENFTADDVTVAEGTSRDSVVATVGIRAVDTVDKIYVSVTAL